MKRYGHLFEKVVSVENCKQAILNASKHKRKRKQVKRILANLDYYANDLSERLKNHNFITPYTKRIIKDGSSGKERELQIPSFYPDQCSHHAIVRVIQPIILKSSYYWSCANIPHRGIDLACIGTERATVRDIKHAKYCVKMDIKKFYPSIPHDKLKARLREKFKDEKLLAVLGLIIDSHEKGLPIGNYTSPWLAELYLQPLDNFIKQQLQIRHYIRYADDLVIIGSNKRKLHKALDGVRDYANNLGLAIKHDYQLFRIKHKGKGRQIDFVGRCFGVKYTTIRKRRALAIMRSSRLIQKLRSRDKPISYKLASGFISRCAVFIHTKSQGIKKKYYLNIGQLKSIIRNQSKLIAKGALA